MKTKKTTEKVKAVPKKKEMVVNYVLAKIENEDIPKGQAMAIAGYSESMQKVPNKLEASKTYKDITAGMLYKGFTVIDAVLASLNTEETMSQINKLNPVDKARFLKTLTEGIKNIMPTVKVKEVEIDETTGKRKTLWTTTPQ